MDGFTGGKCKCARTDKVDLIRAIDLLLPIAARLHLGDAETALRSLSQKLANNRFHLAVLGQMKRGKSSIVNALLGADILPTGLLPLTSVITRVHFGDSPTARILYHSGMSEEVEPQRLHEYITEAMNPGNRKQVASAELLWPSQLLQLGIDLVDTPGIGSTQTQNTATTESYLREIDAAIVVLSVDPPITAVESEFLRVLRCEVPRLLFVVNKTDIAPAREVEELLQFLKHEMTNKCGIIRPEIFPVSARHALEEIRSGISEMRASGIAEIAQRLEYFATEEKEQALLESVAQDVLRFAETLRFAVGMEKRASCMSDEELAEKKTELESAFSDAERELRELRHLLHQDQASAVERIEEDLKRHVQTAIPAVMARLAALQCEHPTEAGNTLGALLDTFITEQIRRVYEDWRIQEDGRIDRDLSALSERFVVRADQVLDKLQRTAGSLFDIATSPISVRARLVVESRLYYYTEPTFKFLQEKILFLLPRKLQRRIAFRKGADELRMELRRNAGRVRYDYLERVEKAIALFEKQTTEAIAMVMDSARMALAPDRFTGETASEDGVHIDEAISRCASILADSQQSQAI